MLDLISAAVAFLGSPFASTRLRNNPYAEIRRKSCSGVVVIVKTAILFPYAGATANCLFAQPSETDFDTITLLVAPAVASIL